MILPHEFHIKGSELYGRMRVVLVNICDVLSQPERERSQISNEYQRHNLHKCHYTGLSIELYMYLCRLNIYHYLCLIPLAKKHPI